MNLLRGWEERKCRKALRFYQKGSGLYANSPPSFRRAAKGGKVGFSTAEWSVVFTEDATLRRGRDLNLLSLPMDSKVGRRVAELVALLIASEAVQTSDRKYLRQLAEAALRGRKSLQTTAFHLAALTSEGDINSEVMDSRSSLCLSVLKDSFEELSQALKVVGTPKGKSHD